MRGSPSCPSRHTRTPLRPTTATHCASCPCHTHAHTSCMLPTGCSDAAAVVVLVVLLLLLCVAAVVFGVWAGACVGVFVGSMLFCGGAVVSSVYARASISRVSPASSTISSVSLQFKRMLVSGWLLVRVYCPVYGWHVYEGWKGCRENMVGMRWQGCTPSRWLYVHGVLCVYMECSVCTVHSMCKHGTDSSTTTTITNPSPNTPMSVHCGREST